MRSRCAARWGRPGLILVLSLAASAACERAREDAAARATRVDGGGETLSRPDPLVAVVTASIGKVELQRGLTGSWSDVRIGDRLAPSDALRTGQGEVDVSVEGVRVRVHESSNLRLSRAASRILRAQVRGSIESEIDPGGADVDMEVEGTDAHARSEGGHFYVTSEGRGVVAVGAVSGSVQLSSRLGSVTLNDGEVSRMAPGSVPEVPTKALKRVLLAVQWPKEAATSKASLPLAGKVAAGSRVFVQGEPIAVAPSGEFRAEVPLEEGPQKLEVVAVDPLGRKRRVETTVVRDRSVPEIRLKRKLWQGH